MKSGRRLLPWVWTGVLAGVALFLVVGEAVDGGNVVELFPGYLLMVLFLALGSLLIVRQAGHTIGWLLLIVGSGLFYASVLSIEASPESSTLVTVGILVLSNWVGLNLIFYPLTLILFLFPDGHFFSSRQAWAGRIGWVMVPVSLLIPLFTDNLGPPFPTDPKDQWTIDNPIGFLPSTILDAFMGVWGVLLVLIAAFGVWSLTTRYRRSSVVVKAQVRWMLLSAFVLLVALVMIVTVSSGGTLFGLLIALAFAFIPVSITIAITRYRLFEIDRLISRTVSYTLVVVALGAVFAALTWLPSFIAGGMNQDGITGSTPPVIVAASTLAVAALFNPVRKRVQRRVDRRFNRSRYQAEAIAEGFSAQLQEPLTVEEIADAWTQTVQEALQPEASGVWIKETPDNTA